MIVICGVGKPSFGKTLPFRGVPCQAVDAEKVSQDGIPVGYSVMGGELAKVTFVDGRICRLKSPEEINKQVETLLRFFQKYLFWNSKFSKG